MTEKLKTLMHEQAGRAEFDVPDVDALVRSGTTRIRRHRLAAVAAGAAAIAVAGGLTLVATSGDDRAPDPADDASTAEPSWAIGSSLYTPSGDIDVGRPVLAYVRTSVGYVFTDGSGEVFSVVDGSVTREGVLGDGRARLVGDADGTVVGWLGRRGVVTFDQEAGRRTTLERGAGPATAVYAVDGRTVYWRDDSGPIATDIDSGETRAIETDVHAAEDGVIAFGVDGGVAVGTGLADALTLPDSSSSRAAFSPDATWVSVFRDEPHVYEVATGERVDLDVDGRPLASAVEWLDDDTVVMISMEDESDAIDLLTCDVRSGGCEVAVEDVATSEELADGFALPFGEPVDD